MRYEVSHGEKIIPAATYKAADRIFKRYARNDDWTRLYCITEGQRHLMKVTSKKLRDSFL